METVIGAIAIVLLLLALPAVAITALVMAIRNRGRTDALERRVVTLERELARRPLAAPAATTTATAMPAEAATPVADVKIAPAPAVAKPDVAARPAAPKPAPTPPQKPKRSLEEILGARWSVIVGGLALALGGIFLVRYSIEQGLIGPATRVFLGGVFSAGLLGLGEKLRRWQGAGETARRRIDIPSVVTSAGAVSAFATIYAAYALYGFLGPAVAFLLLGVVTVATLLAALLHGPILGALGLIGAFVVPLLVSSDAPNVWALLIYLLAPTGAAFAVARIRGWPALAIAAGFGAFLWGSAAPVLMPPDSGALLAYAFALTAFGALLHSRLRLTAPAPEPRPDSVSAGLLSLFALLGASVPAIDGFGSAALIGAGALMTVHLALAAWACGLAPVAGVAAVLTALIALGFDREALDFVAETTSLPTPGEVPWRAGVASFLAFAGAMGAIFLAGGALSARLRPSNPYWWQGLLAAAAAATPLMLLAIAYKQIAALEPDLRFAIIAVLLAGAFALLTEDAARREKAGGASPAATAAFATAAASALGLALAMAMREGALTVALAFLAAALGYVATARPIKALGVLAVIASGIVLARIALAPTIVGDALSTTPVFNALLWGYGAPAVAFWVGSRLFDRAGQPWPAQALEGMALLFALLLGFLQARHFAHGGALDAGSVRLIEAGLQATVAFGLSAAASGILRGRASPVLFWGALATSGLGLLVAAAGLLLGANPLFTGDPVGDGLIFNDLVPGYLLPAIAAFAAARFSTFNRVAWYRRALGAATLILTLAWLSLTVRRNFVGPVLDGPVYSDPEWWAYSVVWLVFGLALLGVGIIRRSQVLRLGSCIILVIVVLKVFLSDLAGIGGIWRALSFIGLGGVLVGVGLVYQRLLFPKKAVA